MYLSTLKKTTLLGYVVHAGLSVFFCYSKDKQPKLYFSSPEEVLSLVSGKLALKYSGSQVEAMKEISKAAKKRSLADFQKVTVTFLCF